MAGEKVKRMHNDNYDSRVLSESDESFKTHDLDSGEVKEYAKHEGPVALVSESFSASPKMSDRLKAIRRTKGWKTWETGE